MRKKTIKKNHIIYAAAKVFSEKGLENATVDDIAREAGIAKGSIYQYFKSRDEIFIEGVSYFATQRIDLLNRLLSHYSTARDKIHALLSANSWIAKRQPEIFFMNYASLISTHKSIKKKAANVFFTTYFKFVKKIIQNGIEKGEFKEGDSDIIALILILTQDMLHILRGVDKNFLYQKDITKELIRLLIPN